MALEAREQAIRAWVKTASGLTDESVFFSNQKVERPASAYVTIRLGDLVPLGAVDPVTENYDADRDPGVEIEQVVEGTRSLGVSIQVFNGAVAGALSAMNVAKKLQLGIRLPSVRDALNTAGMSPYQIGGVRNLAALLGTAFDGRAQLDVSFYVHETVSEFTTYIETAEITDLSQPKVYVIDEEDFLEE